MAKGEKPRRKSGRPKKTEVVFNALATEQLAQLRLRGWSVLRLAEHFGVSHQAVSQRLAIIRERWKEQTLIERAELLEGLDELLSISRDRFDDSLKEQTEVRTESAAEDLEAALKAAGKDSPGMLAIVKRVVTKKMAVGDPVAWMNTILAIQRERAELAGAYPVRKVQVDHTMDLPNTVEEAAKAVVERLQARQAELARRKELFSSRN